MTTIQPRFGAKIPLRGKVEDVDKAISLIKSQNDAKGVPTVVYQAWSRGRAIRLTKSQPEILSRDPEILERGVVVITEAGDVAEFNKNKALFTKYLAELDAYDRAFQERLKNNEELTEEDYHVGLPQFPREWVEYRRTLPKLTTYQGWEEGYEGASVASKLADGSFNSVTGAFDGVVVTHDNLVFNNPKIRAFSPQERIRQFENAMDESLKNPPNGMTKGVVLFGPRGTYTEDEIGIINHFISTQLPDDTVVALAKGGANGKSWIAKTSSNKSRIEFEAPSLERILEMLEQTVSK